MLFTGVSVNYRTLGGEWRGCIAVTPHNYMVRLSVKTSTIGANKQLANLSLSNRGQATKLRECLQHIVEINLHIKNIEQEIFRLAEPYSKQLELIHTVPGLSTDPITAISLLSEIGANMYVFPSAKHLASWAGCCLLNDQSSVKAKSNRISKAGSFLKPLLVQIANAVIRFDKHPECRERYRRIKTHREHRKAIIAIRRMLLTAIWNILVKHEPYSAAGYLTEKITEQSIIISKKQWLQLLRMRGYIFRDELESISNNYLSFSPFF